MDLQEVQLVDQQVMVGQVEELIEVEIQHLKLVQGTHHQYHHHKVILEVLIQTQLAVEEAVQEEHLHQIVMVMVELVLLLQVLL